VLLKGKGTTPEKNLWFFTPPKFAGGGGESDWSEEAIHEGGRARIIFCEAQQAKEKLAFSGKKEALADSACALS